MADLRRATESDAGTVAAMEAAYMECPWTAQMVRDTVFDPLSVLYILEERGKTIGYGGVRVAADTAEIYNIAVDAEHRGAGYGAKLLDALCTHAARQGAREIFLEVSAHNAVARRLYESRGFASIAVRKDYYGAGNDAVIYRRTL